MTKGYWITEDTRKFMARDYLLPGETVESRITDIANYAEKILGIPGFAQEFEDNMLNGFYSLSTPVWANFGRERGLPISCFGSMIEDTLSSIYETNTEVAIMTKMGGGTSAYFGKLRGRGSPITNNGSSEGAVHFMEPFHSTINTVSQGSVRRGAFAGYLPVDHPDIEEFLKIRSEGHPIQNMSIGVCISDEWMHKLLEREPRAVKIWGLIIKKRFETGYPYIFFTDNANNAAPEIYKLKRMMIYHSNLCTEIMLADNENESFVCDLGSMNADRYDYWKNTNAVRLKIYFLDAVMTDFIRKTENIKHMERARNFAIRQRALGLGLLGWNTYLQSKMIPFESMEAKMINSQLWKYIRKEADAATEELALKYGEPELLIGTGRRNVTTLAVAPTTSSAFILGQVSPSIEIENSLYFVGDLAKGKFSMRNKNFMNLLESKGKNDDSTWKSVLMHGGSCQHLSFLDEYEKSVFKTFGETSQKEIIIQAAQRQKDIDQGQSLNSSIGAGVSPKEVSKLIIFAWEQKVKSLYYQRGANPAQMLARSINECKSCEA